MRLKTMVLALALAGAGTLEAQTLVEAMRGARLAANAETCCANRKFLAGTVEIYKLDRKVETFEITPESLAELVAGGYLKAVPTCVDMRTEPARSYFTSGHPYADVGCRVHGTGACAGMERAAETERFGAVEVANTDEVDAIREKIGRALADARATLAAEEVHAAKAEDGSKGGADRARWHRGDVARAEELCAEVEKLVAGGKLSRALVSLKHAYRELSGLAKSRRAWAAADASAAAAIAAASVPAPAPSAAEVREKEKAAMREDLARWSVSARHLTAEEKQILTARPTAPADESGFYQRVDLLQRWIAELKASGRTLDRYETLPARLRTAYMTRSKLKAARALDRIVMMLSRGSS